MGLRMGRGQHRGTAREHSRCSVEGNRPATEFTSTEPGTAPLASNSFWITHMGESLFTGKRVADALYVHVSAIGALLDSNQAEKVRCLLEQVQPLDVGTPNIIKVHTRDNRISLLSYPDFDEAPFPRLTASWTEGAERKLKFRTYTESLNPPILHRKELRRTPLASLTTGGGCWTPKAMK